MFKRLFHRSRPSPTPPRLIENLEGRLLLAAGPAPRITSVFADNRGQVVLTVNKSINAKTLTRNSVQVFTVNKKGTQRLDSKVALEAKGKQIIINANVPADRTYEVRLNSKTIKGTNKARLDGEFRLGKSSGNGKAGGDFIFQARRGDDDVARFTTRLGAIDVRLFSDQTPLTVQNFLNYANRGAWDTTFFHRSVSNFVVQGGGFRVTNKNVVDTIAQDPAVQNEPHPNDPGNILGTIAMAKTADNPNSATNQWFFNLDDNRENLDNQNGGFTAFGQITNAKGLKTAQRIAAKKRVNAGGPFEELPMMDADAAIARGSLDPRQDLILVSRVAAHMEIAKASKKR